MTDLPATWPSFAPTLRESLNAFAQTGSLSEATAGWDAATFALLDHAWELNGRADQCPPAVAQGGGPWTVWLVMGGRGAGKTRTGAEWVRGLALGLPGFALAPVARLALVGGSEAEARDVMIEGPSGLLALGPRSERPTWTKSRRRLEWPNGATASVFSAEDPESLRGPQFEAAWLDEIAKWRYAVDVFDNLQFGLRLGAHPRQVVTTTPRPVPILRRLLADPRTAITRASTILNRANLAPTFLDTVVARYAGTRLGRQELDGELIEDRADALWSRDGLEQGRVTSAPPLARIVVAIDPPATSHRRSDSCGIVAAGAAADGTIYVLHDATLAAARPDAWARAALALYHRLEADTLVAEVNQGGDMVASVIAAADASVSVTSVRATRGKFLRATPVAHLYEQGRVHHVGGFPALEDEMCDFGLDGLSSGRSPDRLDALVWAVTALTSVRASAPRVRQL